MMQHSKGLSSRDAATIYSLALATDPAGVLLDPPPQLEYSVDSYPYVLFYSHYFP